MICGRHQATSQGQPTPLVPGRRCPSCHRAAVLGSKSSSAGTEKDEQEAVLEVAALLPVTTATLLTLGLVSSKSCSWRNSRAGAAALLGWEAGGLAPGVVGRVCYSETYFTCSLFILRETHSSDVFFQSTVSAINFFSCNLRPFHELSRSHGGRRNRSSAV